MKAAADDISFILLQLLNLNKWLQKNSMQRWLSIIHIQ